MSDHVQRVWMLDEEWTGHTYEEQFFHDRNVSFRVSRRDRLMQDLREFGGQADALMAQVGFGITGDLLAMTPHVKGIVIPGVGFDHIDAEATRRRGISVCNVPDYCTDEVADHTLAFIFYFHRELGRMNSDVRQGIWDPLRYVACQRTSQCVVGLIGFGRIAQNVARKARGIGFTVVAYDPYVAVETMAAVGVRNTSLEDLLTNSDYISIHTPKVPRTEGMLTESLLELVKANAVIINTSRAAVADQEALYSRLAGGLIRGAGLDVFENEPLPASSRWCGLPNVLLSPHAAYVSEQAVHELRQRCCEEVMRVVGGSPLKHGVQIKDNGGEA